MNLRHIRVLARHELSQSLLGTRGVLFLVIYGILWFWFLWKLSAGWAASLVEPDKLKIASWLLDPTLARVLFVEHSATLSVFFLICMGMIPIFTMWGAGDQTATDIGTRHLRFLIPRCGRAEIYVGRFLGALWFMAIVHALLACLGTIVALYTDAQPDVIGYGLRVLVVTFLYTLPYVALMSLFGALMGSAAGAILVAIAAYAVVGVAAGFLSMRWEAAQYVAYLFPTPLKGALLIGQGTAYAGAVLLLAVYATVYFLLGWLVFSRRDI